MARTVRVGDLDTQGSNLARENGEGATRQRLGIPADARRVLVMTESSHWDPDWMLTSEQYFRLGVRRTLDMVLDELDKDPRRVWSADCVFFLAMYWDRRPERREQLASLVNAGRIRLTTSGVTTQDTLLPRAESILRDFLIGQEWLRTRGMSQEPTLAYFPDSFGHSPALPTLVRAAGFDRVLVTRIDGAHFVGSDWELPSRFPRPGSSAAALTDAGSADFLWRDRAGAEVLAHWHPFTYGQGDMLATAGVIRYMSAGIAIPARSERRVAARIERYATQLDPLARTPYMLCPIGMDFVNPIRDLLSLIDRYNERRYPDTGLWVTNAGADDYFDLVDAHSADLPVIELDPNPYWTGFYASRPELKRAHRHLVDELLAVEAEAVAEGPAQAARRAGQLVEPWWVAATANHHDFVTGTSPDRVVRREQEPWLRTALSTARRVAGTPSNRDGGDTTPTHAGYPDEPASDGGPVITEWVDGALLVEAAALRARIDPARGGCITSLVLDGFELADGPLADLVAYDDSGGLWRMGNEYRGGHLRAVDRVSLHPARVSTHPEENGGLVVVVEAELDGIASERRICFHPSRQAMRVDTRCAARDRRTITLLLRTGAPVARLLMDQPGGIVSRPVERHFHPTFWPVSTWIAPDTATDGWSVSVDMTRAVAVHPDGAVEVVVARNATKERAWGVLPILACPAKGHEPGTTTAAVALSWPGAGSASAHLAAARVLVSDILRERLETAIARVVAVEPDDDGGSQTPFEIMAMKPATRGDGFILRIAGHGGQGPINCRLSTEAPLDRAGICDVRERDTEELHPHQAGEGSAVDIRCRAGITSVRLVPATTDDER